MAEFRLSYVTVIKTKDLYFRAKLWHKDNGRGDVSGQGDDSSGGSDGDEALRAVAPIPPVVPTVQDAHDEEGNDSGSVDPSAAGPSRRSRRIAIHPAPDADNDS